MGKTADAVSTYLRELDLARTRRHDVARALGMHPNTLGKKLMMEGTSYLSLLNAERRRRLEECGDRRLDVLVNVLGFWHPDSVRRWLK